MTSAEKINKSSPYLIGSCAKFYLKLNEKLMILESSK